MNDARGAGRGPIRVTHVGNSPDDTGGISSVIRLLTTYPIDGVRGASIATYDSTGRWRTLARFLRALARVATGRRGDLGVLHVHLSKGGSLVREGSLLMLARARRMPVVATVHGSSFVAWSSGHPRLSRVVLARADRVTVLSAGARDHLAALGIDRVVLVPNGVPRPAGPRVPAPVPTAVFAGELSTRKGADVLIAAWPAVVARRPEARLVLLGPAADVSVPPGLPGVEQVGSRPHHDVLHELDRAWVAVLPSRAEGLPMFLLEAMAAGCGIVATGVGGIPELFADRDTIGELVRVGDVDALAAALDRSLDASTATERGRAARDLVERQYSVQLVTSRMRDIWYAANER